MKITLAQAKQLAYEISSILNKEIPFTLKFRFQTKFIPDLGKALDLINQENYKFAVKNGADIVNNNTYQYKLDNEGNIVDMEGFAKYDKAITEFVTTNEIEIGVPLKLALFSDIKGVEHYPVLCLFIEE